MKKLTRVFLIGQYTISLVLLIMVVSGCIAHTKVYSDINQEFIGKKYSKILLVSLLEQSELDQAIEQKMKSLLSNYSVECVIDRDIFFRGKKYSDEEYDRIISKNNIDALLLITPAGAGTTDTYIPKRTVTKTKGTITGYGNSARYKEKSTTKEYGGYNLKKPWANVYSELYDIESGEMAWMATTQSAGNAYTSFKFLIKSISANIIKRLSADGIIEKR